MLEDERELEFANDREKEDYIMDQLRMRGIGLSRAAVMIMLEGGVDGICTEEAPIDHYLAALEIAREIGYVER